MKVNTSVENKLFNEQFIVRFALNYAYKAYPFQDKQKRCFSVIV